MSKEEVPNPERLKNIAEIISGFGRFYNGFEMSGAENIPSNGPALIVFYHGLMPLDAWYFGLQFYLERGRLIRGLADRWLFKVPVLKQLVESVGGVEGRPEIALQLLKSGHLVGVSPGGVREAISGTPNNYKLIWGHRMGFAKVAIQAKVPIIPGFTVNVEELYRAPFAEKPFFQNLYNTTRWPIVPIVGLGLLPFPVKLKTIIGEPIPYNPKYTPETLRQITKNKIEELIQLHQPKNQSIVNAIKERF